MILYQTFSDKKPPKEWPDKGQITFNSFYLRYGTDTPYVLNNLNINIEPTEKVILKIAIHFQNVYLNYVL